MEIKKSTLYLTLILVIAVVAGVFFVGNGKSGTNGNVVSAGTGEVQQVTLSYKDFNYYPQTVRVKANRPVRISLDDSVYGCFKSLTIRELRVAKYLATPGDYVEFTPTQKGSYTFSCSMGMGSGKLIVE